MARLRAVVEKNRCAEVARRFPIEVKQIIREEGLAFEDGVVGNIVKYQTIDTGTMMNSVAFDGEDEVKDNVQYGEFVDKGTVHMEPRPFWSDELAESRRRFPKRFRELESRL